MDIDYLKQELQLALKDLSQGRRAVNEGRVTAADTFVRASETHVRDLLDWLEARLGKARDETAPAVLADGHEDPDDGQPVDDDDAPPEQDGSADGYEQPRGR